MDISCSSGAIGTSGIVSNCPIFSSGDIAVMPTSSKSSMRSSWNKFSLMTIKHFKQKLLKEQTTGKSEHNHS
ncbi:unnamed protein product [Brugia timori]|uniref:Uncharacterized protein n=1 Tax=Brugia timori TaxID=42155 RepID=A0A0R3QWJ2_9BILA|nr:unnamed protein product [Brugia timori]